MLPEEVHGEAPGALYSMLSIDGLTLGVQPQDGDIEGAGEHHSSDLNPGLPSSGAGSGGLYPSRRIESSAAATSSAEPMIRGTR